MDSKTCPTNNEEENKNEVAGVPKKKSSPKGRLKPSEDEELQNSDNSGGYKVGSAYQMHLHSGELNSESLPMQKAIPDSPRGQGNVAKDRAKCLASMENSPNPTKL